jgi:hypothetical protein
MATRSLSENGSTPKIVSIVRSSDGIEPHWWLGPGLAHGLITWR